VRGAVNVDLSQPAADNDKNRPFSLATLFTRTLFTRHHRPTRGHLTALLRHRLITLADHGFLETWRA
jgi:hypothetical protein